MSAGAVDVAFARVRYGSRVDPVHRKLLTRQELASIGRLRGPERAAALVAVKQAAMRLGAASLKEPPAWPDLVVRRRENARPALEVGGRLMTWHVSISHGDGLAVAVVAAGGVTGDTLR